MCVCVCDCMTVCVCVTLCVTVCVCVWGEGGGGLKRMEQGAYPDQHTH